jgi:hypothetical protein
MNRTIILGTPAGDCTFVSGTQDYMAIGDGNVSVFDVDGKPIARDASSILEGGIQIVGGRGTDIHPAATPVLGIRGATFKVGYPKAGSKFKTILMLDNVDATKEGVWSVLLATTEDPVWNQRTKWNTDIYTDGTKTIEQVAKEVVALFNTQNSKNLGVKAEYGTYEPKAGGGARPCIKFEADNYNSWVIIPSNNLLYAPVLTSATAAETTDVTAGYKPFLDREYVKDLLKVTAADEGYENVYGDLSELYPGYNNPQLYSVYAMITIRSYYAKSFATVDEPLFQITNLLFPYDSTETTADPAKNVALKSVLDILNKARV